MSSDRIAALSLAVSGASMLLAAVALVYSRRQAQAAEATLNLARKRGSVGNVALSWSRVDRRVIAELTSGDSPVTVTAISVRFVVRRPVERFLNRVWRFSDTSIHLPAEESWLFFNTSGGLVPLSLSEHGAIRLEMGRQRTWHQNEPIRVEMFVVVTDTSRTATPSSPFVAMEGPPFDRTPGRYEGRGGNWHGFGMVYAIENLAGSESSAARSLLRLVAADHGLVRIYHALSARLAAVQTGAHMPAADLLIMRSEADSADRSASELTQEARDQLIEEILIKADAVRMTKTAASNTGLLRGRRRGSG